MSSLHDLPTTADELIRRAYRTHRAHHLVALFLETEQAVVDADPAGAAARALRRLPRTGPLRRQKDRDVLRSIRVIVEELESSEELKRQLRWLLEEAEWRARTDAE